MGLDSRHVILTPPSPLHFNTPSSGFCGFLLTLWNCQSSQWPGQALSLWRRGFKMVPTKQHGRRIWKRHNELGKKKKIPATWETKPGEGEKMSKKEKRAGGGPSSFCSIPQPILSPQSERRAFLALRGVTERKAGTKKRKWEPDRKRGGEQERREWQGGRDGGESNLNRCHQLRHVE